MRSSSDRQIGVALVVLSAIVFSSAGTFTKGVDTGADGVIFWRGLAAAGFTVAYLGVTGRLRSEWARFGRAAVVATVLMSVGTAAFLPAFKLTSVANVALIWAAAPLLSAAMAWAALGEVPTGRVLLASLAAVLGVGVIVSGSLKQGSLIGDGLALVMTIMMAATMVVYRARPDTPAALPAAVSSVLLMIGVWLVADPMGVVAGEMPILVLFGLVFAVASVTMLEGARRLPASETALIGALETPLAPVLALLVIGEVPSLQTCIGGTIIFAAVLWSQMRP